VRQEALACSTPNTPDAAGRSLRRAGAIHQKVSNSGHEFRAYDDALDFIAGRRDADRRASKLAQLFLAVLLDSKLLGLLKVPLYPYQAEGALFAVETGRALIGDDMGWAKRSSHRCGRNSSAAFWRLESPGGLPDLPQVPVAKRDHAFLGRQGENAARVISGGRAQRQKDYTLDDFCKITKLREAAARSRPDRCLGTRTCDRR